MPFPVGYVSTTLGSTYGSEHFFYSPLLSIFFSRRFRSAKFYTRPRNFPYTVKILCRKLSNISLKLQTNCKIPGKSVLYMSFLPTCIQLFFTAYDSFEYLIWFTWCGTKRLKPLRDKSLDADLQTVPLTTRK